MTRRFSIGALVIAVSIPWALAQEHWVATWGASPQETRAFPPLPAPAQQAGAPRTPAPPAPPPVTNISHQTVRMIAHTSIGGRRVRVQFANTFGSAALTLGAAHIALRSKDSAIVPASDRALAFNGKPSCTIPPGATMLSDPVDLDVPQLGDLAVSVFIPGESGPPTMHGTALHTTYLSKEGDFTSQPALAETTTTRSWYFLSRVDVMAPAGTAAIVTFGDSITDGATSTVDADRSWPSFLAQRLLASPATAKWAVVNQGISGNRLLRDLIGANALARFDHDVLSQPGVKWMTLLEGINDIGRATGINAPASDAVTPDELIGAMRQIIERAHTHGIKVLGGTMTPYEGAAYYSETGDVMRETVNRWIRTGGAFDAVVDFDAVVRDPEHPKQIRAAFNERDHLHPNDAGYKAMAEAIDLSLFAPKTSAGSGVQ